MKTKYIVPIMATFLLLSGCSWRDLIYQPSAQEPVTTIVQDEDCLYYQRIETTGYDYDNQPCTFTEEILFDCPSHPDEQYGCIAITRDGESGALNGNYEEQDKDYKTDFCFATFTDLDTGEVYYQLYRSYSTEVVFDANIDYIVVPENVFDKLIEQYGYIRKPKYTHIHY